MLNKIVVHDSQNPTYLPRNPVAWYSHVTKWLDESQSGESK